MTSEPRASLTQVEHVQNVMSTPTFPLSNSSKRGDKFMYPEYFADSVQSMYTIPLSRNPPVKNITLFNRPHWVKTVTFSNCEISSCAFTTDQRYISTADAVVFHMIRLGHPSPPVIRPLGQIWVAFGLEPPMHYVPEFKSPGWRGVFNWTMTYRLDSDIFWPYSKLVLNPVTSEKNYTNIALAKSKSVVWFVSNCKTQSKREQYVTSLQRENISVDIYGKCGSYQCPQNGRINCETYLNTTYRFYLSFENSFCRDYVTEKFFKTFANIDIVPVVRGGVDYNKYFPPGTFINTADFKNVSELARHLKYLEVNTTAYADMLRKKDQYRTSGAKPWCKLCEMLHFEKNVKTYADFPAWLEHNTCRSPTDV